MTTRAAKRRHLILLAWLASACTNPRGFTGTERQRDAPLEAASKSSPAAPTPSACTAPDAGSAVQAQTGAFATLGRGDLQAPAQGPAPAMAAQLSGTCFVLVKNWDFGQQGTVRDVRDLVAEFEFHDQFNTIANGGNYGAVIVAPDAASAIYANGLGLPEGRQPVEDPARPTREWTANSLKAHVRPLSPAQTTVNASAHNAGCGSFMAKWRLPHAGALLNRDLLWETRVRMPVPRAAFWFALWTAGNKWSAGAEMDVFESFGAPHIYPPANVFHVASAGGRDSVDYHSWPKGLASVGLEPEARDLTQWHTWSWLYNKDDTYQVFFDGRVVQKGSLHWTRKGELGGEPIDLRFLFDFSWGHTKIPVLDVTLAAKEFPLTYEIDYSRVYLR